MNAKNPIVIYRNSLSSPSNEVNHEPKDRWYLIALYLLDEFDKDLLEVNTENVA